MSNNSPQDSMCQSQQADRTLHERLSTASASGKVPAVAGFTASWPLPVMCAKISGSPSSSSDSVVAMPVAVEMDEYHSHDVTSKQQDRASANKAGSVLGQRNTVVGCNILNHAEREPSITQMCQVSLMSSHQRQQQEQQKLHEKVTAGDQQFKLHVGLGAHMPAIVGQGHVLDSTAPVAVTQRRLDIQTSQSMQHRLSSGSSSAGTAALPASLSNWGSILLDQDPSVKPSISATAQGRGSLVTSSPLSVVDSGPVNGGSAGCASGQSSRCSSSGSEQPRGSTAVYAGLTPAVTPIDSPVGQLQIDPRASSTVIVSAASNATAGRAPLPPQSPKPQGQLQGALVSSTLGAGATAAYQSSPAATTCPSPRAGMLLKPLSKAGGSSCHSSSCLVQASSPGTSPIKEHSRQDVYQPRMVDQHPANSSSRLAHARMHSAQTCQQPQQATSEGLNALESLIMSRPVYRDISPKLDKFQEQISRQGSWQLTGQYAVSSSASGQLLQQLQDSNIGKPVVRAGGGSAVSVQSSGAHLHSSRSASLLRSPLVNCISPAPPQIPPSPAQQHAAELRSNRRVSSSNIPSPSVSGQLLEAGWLQKQASGAAQQQQHIVQTASSAPHASEALSAADSNSRWVVCGDAADCDLDLQEDEHDYSASAATNSQILKPSAVDRSITSQSDVLVPMFTSHTPRQHLSRQTEQTADQGLVSIIAGGGLALSLAGGQQHRQHHSSAASKPPLHHAHFQQHDAPGTPGSLSRTISGITHSGMQIQQEVAVQQGSKLRKSQSMDPLQQQQHPVPPRRTVPVCRSPSVAMRTVTATPATAPANVHMQCHTPCSPVAEHEPNSNSSSSLQQLWQMGSTTFVPSVSSTGGTPVVTPLSSGRHPSLFAAPGGRGGMALPLPAFEQLNVGGLGRSTSGLAWLDDAAGETNSLDSAALSCYGTAVSESFLQQQQQQQHRQVSTSMAPHPPSSHRPVPLMSPKAGMVLPSVHPHSSHMTASPSVKNRLALGQRQDSGNSSAGGVQQMMQTLLETPRSTALSSLAPAMAGPSLSTNTSQSQAQVPAAANTGQSDLTAATSVPLSAGRSGGNLELSAPPLLTLPGIAEADSAGGSACTTPNMDWGNPADSQHVLGVHSAAVNDVQSDDQGAGQPLDKPPLSMRKPSRHVKKAASKTDADAVSNLGTAAGCPGWPNPVLVAFAHYKGRLGYLMSSGLVGVLFEDSTHMIARIGDNWALYHEQNSKAAAPASTPSSGLGSAADPQQQQHSLPDTGRKHSTVLRDQDSARHLHRGPQDMIKQLGSVQQTCGSLDLGANGLLFMLQPAESGKAEDQSSNIVSTDGLGGSNAPAASRVPEHLEAKARCLKRFIGYLAYNQPYSSQSQPDLTRLPFPTTRESLQQAAAGARGDPLHAGVLHLRRFVLMDGCLLLKLSDGSWELVFLSDNSVLLLDAQCKQLAYISCTRLQMSSALANGELSPTARSVVSSYVTSVDDAAAVPPDAKLLSRLLFASKLVKTLHVPDGWLHAHTAVVAQGP